MIITIIWLLKDAFTTVTLDTDSALHVKYSDAVPYGVFVDINNYPMNGLVTIHKDNCKCKFAPLNEPNKLCK